MNDGQIISLLAAQTAIFARIANALEAIALTNAPAPNFIKAIEHYADFDFTTIGALVKARDANGPTELEWGGYSWTRRSPQNKFGEAIWFSRPTGKDAEGNVKYARLITFKRMAEAEPLPRKVEALVETKATTVYQEKPEKIVEEQKRIEQPARSELKEFFDAPSATAQQPAIVEAWPTTEAEYAAWLTKHGWNGKETYSVLGIDAKIWLKKSPGRTWSDVAKQVHATLKGL